jgi:RimJ/RimL family protein N-acetyltransferase
VPDQHATQRQWLEGDVAHLGFDRGQANLPVRLKVASSNAPSMRLYLRLGFVPIVHDALHIEMEWPESRSAA